LESHGGLDHDNDLESSQSPILLTIPACLLTKIVAAVNLTFGLEARDRE
jgi:hypothetical protein